MDIPVDTFLKQIGNTIIDKLARQDFSANFLQGFIGDLFGKYTLNSPGLKQTQPGNKSTHQDTSLQKQDLQGLLANYKKMYRDVLKDATYVNDYKAFLKKVFTDDTLGATTKKGPLDLIADEQKPLYVILDGLTDKGAKDFKEKLLNNFFKDLKVSFAKSLKEISAGIKKDEKGFIEELLETVPDFSFGIPGFGGGGRDRRRRAPRKKPPARPRPRARPRGRFTPPIPVPAPKPAPVPKGTPPLPKPAPVPKGAPPLPKPAPVPKGAPPLPKGGIPKGGGGIIGRLFLPITTAIEAFSNISDSITELSEKESLSTSQKIAAGGAALTGGAADIITSIDPTSWGIDKMLGYDVFGEGALKELLNVIGAKEEDQTMGESLRKRTTDLFEALNNTLENNLNITENSKNDKFDFTDLLPYLGGATKILPPQMGGLGLGLWANALTQTPEYEKEFSPTPFKDGGVVTKPTIAEIGETGEHEAVIPLDKYFNGEGLTLNNSTLDKIAGNTKDTNDALKLLTEAMFKLVTVFDKKMTGMSAGTTIINGAGGQIKEPTPASLVAANNSDPIRRGRMQ